MAGRDYAFMPTITLCNPADQIVRLRPLLESNWAETGFDFPFDPDQKAYRSFYEAGIAFALVAEDRGEPIGYCCVMVVPHPHNPSVLCGSNDALFVAPECRGGPAAARLIHAAEEEAKRRGASYFTWHCRAGTQLACVLERHGYKPVDVVVMKGI